MPSDSTAIPLPLQVLCFLILTIYFSVWGAVKPPYQSPDEFAHHAKATSVTLNPWLPKSRPLRVHERYWNPLSTYSGLHSLPHHPELHFTDTDFDAMKAMQWSDKNSWREVGNDSRADWYPVLYYWSVFLIGQGITNFADFGPYESFFAYRFASVLIAAFLWTIVMRLLWQTDKLKGHRTAIFVFMILNASLASISSSINPDAMLNPLATILIIILYRIFCEQAGSGSIIIAGILMVISMLTKATGVFFLPVVAACACISAAIKKTFRPLIDGFLICTGSSLISYFGFYFFVEPERLILDPTASITFLEYMKGVPQRMMWMFHSFCGVLGWLEYGIEPKQTFNVLYFLLGNMAFALIYFKHWWRSEITWLAICFAAVFSAVLVFLEYYNASRVGLVLQGRYFLPGILGMAMLLVHRFKSLRWIFIIYLAYINVHLLDKTLLRYYGPEYRHFGEALP